MCVSDSLQPHGLYPIRLLLFIEFFRQGYWSRMPFPTPGHLPNPGIKLASLASPVLAGRFLTTSATWEAFISSRQTNICEIFLELTCIHYYI